MFRTRQSKSKIARLNMAKNAGADIKRMSINTNRAIQIELLQTSPVRGECLLARSFKAGDSADKKAPSPEGAADPRHREIFHIIGRGDHAPTVISFQLNPTLKGGAGRHPSLTRLFYDISNIKLHKE